MLLVLMLCCCAVVVLLLLCTSTTYFSCPDLRTKTSEARVLAEESIRMVMRKVRWLMGLR